MNQKKVVVTGMGIVSCFGTDVDQFYSKLLQGESGVRPIESLDVSEFPTRFAAEVKDLDCEGYLDKKQARRVDPFVRYSVVAGKKALEMSGITPQNLNGVNPHRVGVLISSGMGGMKVFSDGVQTVLEKGFSRLTPFFVPYIITNMGGAILSMDFGFTGPNYSISTACATATHSIIAAANHIRRGDADIMVCGGAEAPINLIGLSGFVACKALSERNDDPQAASRPWDLGRDGFVMGEGAGVLVLETEESALRRGVPILAEYLGGGMNADAYHITEPRSDGSMVAECMKLALQDGNIQPEDVDYINAHATSTLVGDLCEVRGMKLVFPKHHLAKMKVNGSKSLIGHGLGAAGGFESVITIKAIQTGQLHPTLNLENPEPELEGIDVVPGKAIKHPVRVALNNSFGFGGHNASIVFGRYD
ncbi:MAG: beta-ketoacyl-ACP synthase II [Simkaniaceae bacterium]|nr:beta-ketoacyl-ACP synthase II [Simkaniaceae bacterium]